jgi:hypothetical protein
MFGKTFQKAKDGLKKAKAGAVVATGAVLSGSNAMAAVTYDSATNTFSGDIDLSAYYSVIPIAITVIGVTIATSLAINALKRSK